MLCPRVLLPRWPEPVDWQHSFSPHVTRARPPSSSCCIVQLLISTTASNQPPCQLRHWPLTFLRVRGKRDSLHPHVHLQPLCYSRQRVVEHTRCLASSLTSREYRSTNLLRDGALS